MKHTLRFALAALLLAALLPFTLNSCDSKGRGGRGSIELQKNGASGEGAGPEATQAQPEEDKGPGPVKAATSWGAETATLRGQVVFAGDEIPENRPVALAGTANCLALHPDGPPPGERYLIGKGEAPKAIQNVIVYVSQGLEAGMKEKKFDTPSEEVIFDQKGCIYVPHVLAVRAKQPFKVLNSDPLLHNVNIQSKANPKVNKGTLANGSFTHKFRKPEPEPILIKCDVHPWMNAYVGVFEHPYFTVTDANGNWEFPRKLPAGQYAVTFWHEKLEGKTVVVTVADGQEAIEVESVALSE